MTRMLCPSGEHIFGDPDCRCVVVSEPDKCDCGATNPAWINRAPDTGRVTCSECPTPCTCPRQIVRLAGSGRREVNMGYDSRCPIHGTWYGVIDPNYPCPRCGQSVAAEVVPATEAFIQWLMVVNGPTEGIGVHRPRLSDYALRIVRQLYEQWRQQQIGHDLALKEHK